MSKAKNAGDYVQWWTKKHASSVFVITTEFASEGIVINGLRRSYPKSILFIISYNAL
jgi:hypothetical protein